MAMDPTFRDFRNLSVPERIQLAEDLWDSVALEPDAAPGLTNEQARVAEARLASYRAHPDDVVAWGDLLTRLYSRSS